MSVPLKTLFDPSKPLAPQLDAEWLRTVADALNSLNVAGGHIDKSTGSWTITVSIEDSVLGTKALYKIPACREYVDSTGALVAAGSETGGAGRSLHWTWDYVRAA